MVTLVLAHQRTPDVGPSDQTAGQHADREATEMCLRSRHVFHHRTLVFRGCCDAEMCGLSVVS
jgi:hypothetical protein